MENTDGSMFDNGKDRRRNRRKKSAAARTKRHTIRERKVSRDIDVEDLYDYDDYPYDD
jgi:hypothetical protein